MKTKVLFIASEHSSGMIPFAAKIITVLSNDERFDVYALVVNSGNYTYKRYLSHLDAKKIIQIEYPQSKIFKLIYKFYPFSILESIKKIVNDVKPEIIHLLTVDFSLAPYFLFHKTDNRFFFTVHDLHPHEVKTSGLFEGLLLKYIQWGNKFLYGKINNLTTSSKLQYEELRSIYPQKRIRFTHFPSLLTQQIINGNKQIAELQNISNYILFFGRVDEYKGVDLLIKAYISSATLQNYKLVIAGKGCSYSDLIGNNKGIIHLNRFIEDSEINDLFNKAKFVVYPYRSATMSGVLSLSYFFKKKTILSSVPFFVENKTSCSTYFKTGDVDDLRSKMEMLTEDQESCCENCYEEIYSDNILINDYNKLYSSL